MEPQVAGARREFREAEEAMYRAAGAAKARKLSLPSGEEIVAAYTLIWAAVRLGEAERAVKS